MKFLHSVTKLSYYVVTRQDFQYFTGVKGRTDYLKLDKWFHNDFEAGSKEQYQVEAFDVGDIHLIELHSDGGGYWSGDPDWFVNKVD